MSQAHRQQLLPPFVPPRHPMGRKPQVVVVERTHGMRGFPDGARSSRGRASTKMAFRARRWLSRRSRQGAPSPLLARARQLALERLSIFQGKSSEVKSRVNPFPPHEQPARRTSLFQTVGKFILPKDLTKQRGDSLYYCRVFVCSWAARVLCLSWALEQHTRALGSCNAALSRSRSSPIPYDPGVGSARSA